MVTRTRLSVKFIIHCLLVIGKELRRRHNRVNIIRIQAVFHGASSSVISADNPSIVPFTYNVAPEVNRKATFR